VNKRTKIHNERRKNHIKDLTIQDMQFSHDDLNGKIKDRYDKAETES